MKLVAFMTSVPGRMLRFVAGLILISAGLFVVQGTAGAVMAVVGLLPLAAGALDFCTVGALLGYPLAGPQARERVTRERAASRGTARVP